MHNLKRFYNQNRKNIWKIILIIIAIIGIIRFLDYTTKEKKKEKSQITNQISSQNIQKDTTKSEALVSESSSLYGTSTSSTQIKKESNAIDNFIQYCNKKEIENAYNLLTDECKEELYPTLEDFTKNYYNVNFNNSTKPYTIENMQGNLYKVRILEDMLATGKSNNGEAIQDYMTTELAGKGYKLNINGYIGRKTINNENQENDIKITVIDSDIFMDYQKFRVKIENNSDNRIMLDNKDDIKSIYLEDVNGNKYSSYSHELIDNSLIVNAHDAKELEIKFYSSYSLSKNLENLVFSKVIVNYDDYLTYANPQRYTRYLEIKVEI